MHSLPNGRFFCGYFYTNIHMLKIFGSYKENFRNHGDELNGYGRPPIVLVTDFGDSLAQTECLLAIHGTFSRNNVAPTHVFTVADILSFNKIHGAFIIDQLATTAPEGTIIVGVVDPGVGTQNDGKREGIIIKTKKHIFIGPNNGIFTRAVRQEGIIGIYAINTEYFPNHATTFDGRDIFSVAAAEISSGRDLSLFTSKLDKSRLVTLQFQPGQVIHVDSYGNIKIFSEIPKESDTLILEKDNLFVIPIVDAFGDVEKGQALAYKGSSRGLLEIALRESNAAKHFGIFVGDCLDIRFSRWHKKMQKMKNF